MSVLTFPLLRRSHSARRRSGRLETCYEEAVYRIREHLNSESVLRATAEGAQRGLGSGKASIWLTTGSETPRLAYAQGSRTTSKQEMPPRSVSRFMDQRKVVVDREMGSVAVPIVAPRSGLVGILCFEGAPCNSEQLAFLKDIARESGHAIESANLYEKAVAEREKSDAILTHVADGVVVTDSRGKVLQLNDAATRILGCSTEVAVQGSCAMVLGLRTGERPLDCSHRCALLDTHEAASHLGTEVWRQQDGGNRQPLLANVSIVKDVDGNISEVVHSFRDITRIKEADEAKTLFLATASHELRTPLTVIQGFSQLLSNGPQGGEHWKEALQAMEKRAIQLNKIVERLLLSSRIEAGHVEISTKEVDLMPILKERVEELGAASGREVVLEIDPALPLVLADPDAVTTVVDHLLDNAVKYSPDLGTITLKATYDQSRVRISVTDSGIGMDSERMAHCFDKFWQGESTDSRRFGGTGIGLFIVKSLVEAMEGDISVESAPEVGSTFVVALPRVGAGPASEGPDAPSEKPVAADQSVIREFMRQIGIPTGRTQ